MSKHDVVKAEMEDKEPEETAEDSEESEADKQKKEREKEDRGEKSVAVDDLMKSIADYDAIEEATTTSGGSRESFLKSRYDAGVISKSELSELGRIPAGETHGEPMAKSLQDRVAENDKDGLVDASPFLKSLVDDLGGSLQDLGGRIDQDGRATRELFKAQGLVLKGVAKVAMDLHKSNQRQSRVIEALESRLGMVERQPQVRKSVGGRVDPRDVRAAPGRDEDPNKLTKSQGFEGLARLARKADADGNDQLAKAVAVETARLEGQGQINPKMIPMVREVLGLTG